MTTKTTPKKAMTAIVGIGALLLAVLVTVPSASAIPSSDFDCITLTSGELACGNADSVPCAGSGEGVATGLVNWELVVASSPGGPESYTLPAASAAFARAGPSAECWTNSCTYAVLYANGQEVTRSQTVCWDI